MWWRPGFLEFLNRGLDRYADAEQVFQISGYMYPGRYGEHEAFFLPMISCWGWATWKRAWAHYDGKMSGFGQLTADESLRRRFNLNGAYDYFSMASQQYNQSLRFLGDPLALKCLLERWSRSLPADIIGGERGHGRQRHARGRPRAATAGS